VDDNEVNRRIVHEQVLSWGMRNEMAEDGPSALAMLRKTAEGGEPYDLAIVDMQMPGMDGMELATKIKAEPSIASTKLILLTSMGLRGEAEQARRVGFSAYLTKPVKQSKLYDTVAAVVIGSERVEVVQERRHEEAPTVTSHSLEEAKVHSHEELSKGHVLVAEDNAVNQRVAIRMLERIGYRADVAANGLEALEALSRIPYDAVLMDVQMPEMDGYEATDQIRHREEGTEHHTPIIAMTASAMQGDREKAIEAGMDDYVSKPVKLEELERVLGRWGSGPRAGVYPQESSKTEPTDETIEHLDRATLDNVRELGGPEMISELAEMFVEDTCKALQALEAASADGDADSVMRISHTLKGSSSNMGAMRMAEICAELERTGASEDLTHARELLERLEAEFECVRPALTAEVRRNE
jgi:two-component system sensor histidine kinase/response regulator